MRRFLEKAKVILSNALVSRALHTFWQGALSVLVVGMLSVHTSRDVKLLLIGAVAAGLSAVKTMTVAYVKGLKS